MIGASDRRAGSVRFVDSSFVTGVDAHWNGSVSAAELLAGIGLLDTANFDCIEIPAPQPLDLAAAVPDWLMLVREAAPRTRLRMVGQGSEDAALLSRMVDLGFSSVRKGRLDNDAEGILRDHASVSAAGLEFIADVAFSGPTDRTDVVEDRAFALVSRLAESGVERVCLTDIGGVYPESTVRAVVERIQRDAPSVLLELHVRCSNWLGPVVAAGAVESGLCIVHAAARPLASAESLPDVAVLSENLRARGRDVRFDGGRLRELNYFLQSRARRRRFPEPQPREFDSARLRHRTPEPLAHLLEQHLLNADPEVGEVLSELERIEADLAWPVPSPPLLSAMIAQAIFHVAGDRQDRYRRVSATLKEYVAGESGDAEVLRGISQDLVSMIRVAESFDEAEDRLVVEWEGRSFERHRGGCIEVATDLLASPDVGTSSSPIVWFVRDLIESQPVGRFRLEHASFAVELVRANDRNARNRFADPMHQGSH